MSVKDMFDVVVAGKAIGMKSDYTDRVSQMGAAGQHESNLERDFLRYARSNLGVEFRLYETSCITRRPGVPTKTLNIPVLLPHEMAHLLWHQNQAGFYKLFQPDRIRRFWECAIAAAEPWFAEHPLNGEITASTGRSKYLPIHLFGDDGCLKKSRVMGTITWFPATYTELEALESRIPCYLIPQHMSLKDITEVELQRVISWSFTIWLSGRCPSLDHLQSPFPNSSFRAKLAGTEIAGGHIGVYVSTIADALWMSQHYRFAQSWGTLDICNKCFARNDSGVHNFAKCVDFPERLHSSYMASPAAAASPLAQIPGYHISMNRGEPMHVGPLGVMPDVAGSALQELCIENVFGGGELSPWEFRFQTQLNIAYDRFVVWCKQNRQCHTIKRFGRHGFCMTRLHGVFPYYKGKAHNCLVLCRWLEIICAEHTDTPQRALRAQVLFAWVDVFQLCFEAPDPDFLTDDELKRLDQDVRLLMHGHRVLSNFHAAHCIARWNLRPKIHSMDHINKEAQLSRRNPRAWFSFKEEEMMGKLARIACAVHAVSLCARSLERWCLQFFCAMEGES